MGIARILDTVRRYRPSAINIPTVIAIAAILSCAFLVDYQNRRQSLQDQRTNVLAKLNIIRTRLEGNIQGDMQLIRGLVAVIQTEPGLDQRRFSALAGNILSADTQLRNIAAAPDLIIRLTYPVEGNEKAIGLDYRAEPSQRIAAMRARDEKRLVLAGPVDLRQGGQGFVGRYPVFISTMHGQQFWGLVSGVVDVHKLYQASGLFDKDLGIDVAIRGRDGLGANGAHFFGPASMLELDPVGADVILPSGTWRILGTPKNGWVEADANVWYQRSIIAAVTLALLGLVLYADRLARERQRSFQKLALVSQRLKLALEVSSVGVWEQEIHGGMLKWDQRTSEIFGRTDQGLMLNHEYWLNAVHPEDRAKALSDYNHSTEGNVIYSSEYRIVRPDGEIRHLRSKAALHSADGHRRMIGAEWDVTDDVRMRSEIDQARMLAESRNEELERAKARLEHTALHDALTGLPNRHYLDNVLQAASTGEPMAILHIDLDRFKHINDTLGHAAGDAMLMRAAQVLTAHVRPADFVARIGGDEFVVVCKGCDDVGPLAVLAGAIVTTMREPVAYRGNMCRFGVSIGIAVSPEGQADPKQLLINADLALYRAKRWGRNRYEFFDQVMQLDILHTKLLADEILTGLERNEFEAHYQPQFDAETLQLAGVEALVRWRHPRKGLLAPGAFMSIADELNVVAALDKIVLTQAKRDFDEWAAAGLDVHRISVNVSARRLEDMQLVNSLRELDLTPGTVSFELVESIFLDEGDDVRIWNVEQIKDLGIDIEIDDFGTGYASIVSLLKLKPRRLKIDRQLVSPIVDSDAQCQLVGSIVEIGKSLGIEVIAEGVETDRHVKILRELGCDILQGYALGRPMDKADLLSKFGQGRKPKPRLVVVS